MEGAIKYVNCPLCGTKVRVEEDEYGTCQGICHVCKNLIVE